MDPEQLDDAQPDDDNNAKSVRPPASGDSITGAEEVVRDWQLLFWGFLLFGLVRLAWLYFYRPENIAFNLGISCGFLFCGVLGFLMRYVLSPRLRKQ
jgi:hypothetical protein